MAASLQIPKHGRTSVGQNASAFKPVVQLLDAIHALRIRMTKRIHRLRIRPKHFRIARGPVTAPILLCIILLILRVFFPSYPRPPNFSPQLALPRFQRSDLALTRGEGVGHLTSEARENTHHPIEETIVHDVIPTPSPWPAEAERADPALYGTSREKCFALGASDEHPLWQSNSRALCVVDGQVSCLKGRNLAEWVSGSPRGSTTCEVVHVETGHVRKATEHEMEGSCARFRDRRVVHMFATSETVLSNPKTWVTVNKPSHTHKGSPNVQWYETVSIIVPKYEWSWNICHYNRIFQFVMYVLRHMDTFFQDADKIRHVDVLFRAKYPYSNRWATDLRNVTIPAMEREFGRTIRVAKVRYDGKHSHHCFSRAVFLGQEGRVDAFPFLNDTSIWSRQAQILDNHVPVIPHDALWFRNATYSAFGLEPVAEYQTHHGSQDGRSDWFVSIPVPPLVLGHIKRSSKSKRRFDPSGKIWFDGALRAVANAYGLELREISFDSSMSLREQARLVRHVGIAAGIHGANFVNTQFMPPGAALMEVFPYKYVRYYYAAGANTGLRYSFHEVITGRDRHCEGTGGPTCAIQYRESVLQLTSQDRDRIAARLEAAAQYLVQLHKAFPSGRIPLQRRGNTYHMPIE